MNKGAYTYDYPRPAVTADCVVFCNDSAGLSVLLIERANKPFKGCWAFPGGLKEIRESVKTFTQYATEHPDLHFLVTPIGCGGGCRSPREIAPMFREASRLTNVSLPQEFWKIICTVH